MTLPERVGDRLRPRSRAVVLDRLPRPTVRALAATEHWTLTCLANVHAHGLIQSAKVDEIHRIGHNAVARDVALEKLVSVMTGGDLLSADRVRPYTDLVRLGCGEMIADLIETYSREGRGGRW